MSDVINGKQLLRKVRMNIFDYAAIAQREVARVIGHAPICRAGCSHCCNQKIITDGGQGAAIALYLENEGRWTPALVDHLARADEAMTAYSHANWMGRQTPCAFLRGGSCSVYPARPIACAATYSAMEDPDLCAVPDGKAACTLRPSKDLARAVMAPYEAILSAARETKNWLMTLPGAVLYGHALLERIAGNDGAPLPPVFRVAREDWAAMDPRPGIEEWWDAQAANHFRDAIRSPSPR